MFFPGETITHTFIVPFAANEINNVVLSYKQNGAIVLEKTITSGFESESTQTSKFSLTLTQNDSLLFEDNSPFTIQCNVFTNSGTRHASHEMNSSSGIQYLRDTLTGVPVRILVQPTNFDVENIGVTATFKVSAQGVNRYKWQYSYKNGTWKSVVNGNQNHIEVVASLDVINNYRYRCVVYGYDGSSLTTNVVIVNYIE